MTRMAMSAPASMPGKKPAMMATPGKLLHWVDGEAAARAVVEDAVGEGIVVARLGTWEAFVGAGFEVEDGAEDVEAEAEDDVGVVCLSMTHMLFWQE